MRAGAAVVVSAAQGGCRFDVVRSEPPLLLRQTPGALQLVGGAAGPLGGDDLALSITVGAAARLAISSVAATVVLPGGASRPIGRDRSRMRIDAQVAGGGHLDWAPRPLVSVVGSDHVSTTTVRLAADATLRWRETIVLGRTDESPGHLVTRLRVERAGVVVADQELRFGGAEPAWEGPAVLDGATVISTEIRVGPGEHRTSVLDADGVRSATFSLADDVSLVTALARDMPSLEAVR